jgi:hypothetical protein
MRKAKEQKGRGRMVRVELFGSLSFLFADLLVCWLLSSSLLIYVRCGDGYLALCVRK